MFLTQHGGFMIRVSAAALNFRIQHFIYIFCFVWEWTAFTTSLTILKVIKHSCFKTPPNITHRSIFKRGERGGALSALLQQKKTTWELCSFYSKRGQILTCETTVTCYAGKEPTKKIILICSFLLSLFENISLKTSFSTFFIFNTLSFFKANYRTLKKLLYSHLSSKSGWAPESTDCVAATRFWTLRRWQQCHKKNLTRITTIPCQM